MSKLVFEHPESDGFFCMVRGQEGFYSDCLPVDPTKLPAGTEIQTGLGVSVVLPSADFETYSEAGFTICPVTGKVKGTGAGGKGGLGVVGTPVYAEHPSTEILCLYYDLKDGLGRRSWYPGTPYPLDLLQHVAAGGLIEAWNVTFEFWIWNMICVRRYGWPVLALDQCRCAMAQSRRHSLPGSLAACAKVLGTPEKDKAGSRLIQKLCRPHTPTKKRPEHRWTALTAWDDYLALYKYCDRDVETEDHASAQIPDLTPYELTTWKLDQTINARGVQVDVQSLDAALDILGQAERKYTMELVNLTGGAVGSVSEVAKLGAWVAEQGVHMADMQKQTVEDTLKRDDLPSPARRALEIRETLGAANVKKLRKLKQQVSSDGRLRNQYMYCGADRTGRASSAAADDGASNSQLQNITGKGPKTCECESCGGIFGKQESCPRCGAWMVRERLEWTVEAVEAALADIMLRDLDTVERIWGDPIVLLCGCLRGLFIAREGHELICVDFSAVEAVVAACLARCQWRIDVFNTHGKIYEMSAANATGIPFEEIIEYKKRTGRDHKARKTIGKVRELANGYGGWIGANKNFGADKFMTDEEIKADILKWRDESKEIVEMWGSQFKWCGPGRWDFMPCLFGLEGAAINAILHPGQCYSHIDITYGVHDDILFCRLPSGRFLKYHKPRLLPGEDKLRRGPCYEITFEGHNSNSMKGPVGWQRLSSYSGRLFENVVQAVAADIQFEALARCEERGYYIVMHTHDEGSAEMPTGQGSVEQMTEIMIERPSWASWWPLRGAGWRGRRYRKD